MLRDLKKEAAIEEEIFHASLLPWQRQLLGAAEYLKRYGWHQGSIYASTDFNPAACAWGAIRMQSSSPNEARMQLDNFVNSDGNTSIGYWNDAPNRTMQEVIATLHLVALG